MKALIVFSLFFAFLAHSYAQENVYNCHTLSYLDDIAYNSDARSVDPIVFTYENDPVSKISYFPETSILEVNMREMEGRNLFLTDQNGTTLVSLVLDNSRNTYRFSLAAYDSEILYLMTNGESGLFRYTIDKTGK